MKRLSSYLFVIAFGLAIALQAVVFVGAQAYADISTLSIQSGVDAARGNGMATDLFGQSGVFQEITNTLLFIIGSISVIMLIIGGLRYVVSGGDSSAVTAAKNTILYAIIGVIVSLLAYAAIAFVINSFSASSTGTI